MFLVGEDIRIIQQASKWLSLCFSIGEFIQVFGKLNGVRQADNHSKIWRKCVIEPTKAKSENELQHQLFVNQL